MSIQGALSGATNQIIGASIAAAKKKEAAKEVKTPAPEGETHTRQSDAEALAKMGIYVDPSRINTPGPVSRKVIRPLVDEQRREMVMQQVKLAQESRKLTKEQSRLYISKIKARRKAGV